VEKYRNLPVGEGACVSPMCGIQTHDVVDTDCTGSCKSNYDTITIEHDAPHKQLENLNFDKNRFRTPLSDNYVYHF
jgi:hypothetical protein